MVNLRPSAKFDKKAALVLLTKEQVKNKKFPFKYKSLEDEIVFLKSSGQFTGANGEIFPLVSKKQIVLLAGVGDEKKISLTKFRGAVRCALKSSYLKKIKDVEIIPYSQKDEVIISVIEAVEIGMYSWKKYLSKDKDDKSVEEKSIHLVSSKKPVFQEIMTISKGVNAARDLVNDNADNVTSVHFEKEVKKIAQKSKKMSVTVLNRKELKSKGLNLHLAVNQGSNKEPKLIIVKYNGAGKTAPYTAIVGKGVTFDSGGLNLKPGGHMEAMRMDMAGAAAVLGILKNVSALNLKKNMLFVMGLAENAIGKNSYKPGDVIKSYKGMTVEIGNTDAEGRLVLADAVAYVTKNYKPKHLIDLATLTGACIVALGYEYTGLISNDDSFARKLLASANKTDDWAWQLPSYDGLEDRLKSQYADIKNISNQKGSAGTLTGAEFIRQFLVGDVKWAHLDIAGTAFVEGKSRMYFGYGATGAGVRLITDYLKNN